MKVDEDDGMKQEGQKMKVDETVGEEQGLVGGHKFG